MRIGLIEQDTGTRLPVYSRGGQLLGDHLQLGLLYVADGVDDPRIPATPLRVRLGEQIDLLGYSMP